MRCTHLLKTRSIGATLVLFLGGFFSNLQGAEIADGIFQKPFSGSSIWKLPISSGAQLVSAGLSSSKQNIFNPGRIGVHKVNTANPLRKVFQKTYWGTCTSSPNNTLLYNVNLPDDLVIAKTEDNGIHCFIFPDGGIYEQMLFERCSAGSNAAGYGYFSGDAIGQLYPITGTGIPQRGSASAAGMSGLGGVIRSGELTTGNLNHSLKLALTTAQLYWGGVGYRWPAQSTDSYAASQFKGTVPALTLGSLLTVSPNFGCSSLKSTPGRRICDALKTYGAYVVDSCCPTTPTNAWWLVFEQRTPTDFTVAHELRTAYNIILSDPAWGGVMNPNATPQTADFKSDLDSIYNNLQVVANASASNPKGGGSVAVPPPPTNLQIAQSDPVTVTTEPEASGVNVPMLIMGVIGAALILKD